jgi:arabinogalactan oligomer / maltooligosaccharide transport system permease protein
MARLGLLNTLVSLVIAYLTVAVPFCAWMLEGYFDSIPISLDVAASVDGCGPFGTFWRVIMPLARPGLAVTAFFTFLTAWGEVAYASAFIQTDNRFTLAYGLQQFVPQFNPSVGVPHRGGGAGHAAGLAGLLRATTSGVRSDGRWNKGLRL